MTTSTATAARPRSRIRLRAVLIGVAVGLSFAWWRHEHPSRRPLPPSVTAGLREVVLPNGLTVLTKEVHGEPLVAVALSYRVGIRNEKPEEAGISHLLEHLTYRGTRGLPSSQMDVALQGAGGRGNGYTGPDSTCYTETVSADQLPLALKIEAERMRNCILSASDLELERSIVRSELEGNMDSPESRLSREVTRAAFTRHPYRWWIGAGACGAEETLRIEQLRRYYRDYYAPNNAVLVLVGDLRHEQAAELARRYFGKIAPAPVAPPEPIREPRQIAPRRVTLNSPAAGPIVTLAYRGPAGDSPDGAALDVLRPYLADGAWGRLWRAMPGRLVSGLWINGGPHRDPFLITVTAIGAPGADAAALEAELKKQLRNLTRESVGGLDLDRARNRVIATAAYRQERLSDQAFDIAQWIAVADWHRLDRYLQQVSAVNDKDLQRVLRRYFDETQLTTGVLIPSAPLTPGKTTPPPGSGDVVAGEHQLVTAETAEGAPPLALVRDTPRWPVHHYRLKNGIEVVVLEKHASPTFSLRAALPAGSLRASREQRQVAELTARSLWFTDGLIPNSGWDLGKVGAELFTTSFRRDTVFRGRALSRDLDQELDALARELREPRFAGSCVARERELLEAELAGESTDSSAVAWRALLRALYPAQDPRCPPPLEQDRALLHSLGLKQARDFYREHYGPEKLTIVLVGDLDPRRVREAVGARFGSWGLNPRDHGLSELPSRRRPHYREWTPSVRVPARPSSCGDRRGRITAPNPTTKPCFF